MQITIDESQFVTDWIATKQALDTLQAIDNIYGPVTREIKGITIELVNELRAAMKKAILGKLESDLLDLFRDQLGQ